MTPPPFGCCPTAPFCDACMQDQLAQMRGVARARGELWASRIADVIEPVSPWPMTDKMRAIARRKCRDISRGDERLLEALTDECVLGAAHWRRRVQERAG